MGMRARARMREADRRAKKERQNALHRKLARESGREGKPLTEAEVMGPAPKSGPTFRNYWNRD